MSSAAYRRIVVKVGTSTLTGAAGSIDRAFISDLAAQLAAQRAAGCDVLLVTSGAIRAGRDELDRTNVGISRNPAVSSSLIPHPSSLPYKQAAAAIGQGLLMHTYTEAFASNGVSVAQILLTRDDLADRRRFLNARNTLSALLSLGVIPIINENDTVAVDEIKFGDNDNLAAHVAVLVEADLLLILSDVEGLYDRRPDETAATSPELISVVEKINKEIEALAGGAGTLSGTGGMRTKVEAARIATSSGITAVITKGRRSGVIQEVTDGGGIGTTFTAGSGRLRGRKRWIAAGSRTRGSVTINCGAAEKLRAKGVSLLAVGIIGVEGQFEVGDLIQIRDEAERRLGQGLTNYSAADLRQIQGVRSDQVETILGYKSYDEVVHRDNMVLNA
jgi:glutamate 5-kinase